MSKKRFRPQICLILQQSCCLYSKSCCWIIRSCRYFSKVVSELSVFLTSWILARGDPFLKAHFQFGAEPLLRAGERKSLIRRSKGRLGVPPGGAEQGEPLPWRGMVTGKYKQNSRRRIFLGVFPTADKSRGTRTGTVGNNVIRKARVLFRNHSCPSIVSSILATNSLGCISKAPAIFQIVSKFACFVPFSIMDKCVRAIPANPLSTSWEIPFAFRRLRMVCPTA